MAIRFSAPASSANLGAGFDCLALALELRCTVSASFSDQWEVIQSGAELTEQGEGVISKAAMTVGEAPLRLEVDNAIPVGRGLGWSAAARAATLAAARWRAGIEPDPEEVYRAAAKLEGHADNAAAAVFGGLVAVGPDGAVARLRLHRSLVPVVAVPDAPLSTELARRALPQKVEHGAAARSVARAVFLVEGLRSGDPQRLSAAMGDELHEPYRARLFPAAAELVRTAWEAGASFAAWSGAGSSVLALVKRSSRAQVVGSLEKALDERGRVLVPEVSADGLR